MIRTVRNKKSPYIQPLFQPYFWLGVVLYLIVRIGRLGAYNLPELINNYLTDFICMPLILTLCLVGVRLAKQLPQFILSPSMIISMTAFYSVLFEYLLPMQSIQYTADGIDVVMYFTGAAFYWAYWRFAISRIQYNLIDSKD